MAEDVLSDEFFVQVKKRLKTRLDPSRYKHSKSVSDTAVLLARSYGVDESKARLAGLLHDWDKAFCDVDIASRAVDLGARVNPEVLATLPRLLHGPTAALDLAQEYPQISADVLQSIARHTSAEIGMSDLDMVVYIADVIEPLRPFDDMRDIEEAVGLVSLEELFLMTFRHVLLFLVERKRKMHPDTVKVWNHYVDAVRTAPKS